MQFSFDLERKQFWKALSLLGLSFFLNLVPLIYSFLNSKYTDVDNYGSFLYWVICNSEIYFLLLSTVFTSFIEYIITTRNIANGLVFFNVVYVIMISAVWAMTELRIDLVQKITEDVNLTWFLVFLIICAALFCFINLLFMNLKENMDNRQNYLRKKVF